MPGIKDRVAIIGMGCTKFGEHWDKGPDDLIVEACHEAMEDAGIGVNDIQAAWLGSTGTASYGCQLAAPLKLHYVPVTKVENACATGTDAFRNGCYAVAAGIYDIVLVCGVEKLKDTGFAGLGGGARQATAGVEPRSTAPASFATAATRYFHHYELTYEQGKELLARIAVKNHKNGSLNPKAHFQREITVEQAMNAPMIAYPLGLFDCCGVSDGSAAAIITRPELAPRFKKDYLLVKALGIVSGAQQATLQNSYDYVHFEENVAASRMAYKEADIKNPRKEIDLAEVHDCFTITELLIYEDLGFSPRGGAKEDIMAGTFQMGGELPVNPDGGLKCFGHPIGASGLRMMYEVYKQLRGQAGPRQIKNPRLGLTHNLGGSPGAFTCSVAVFGLPE